jgi:hypothetical protein
VSRVSRICAIAALLCASSEAVSATEKFAFIWAADAVVVGQLKLSSYFLSFDGLHVNGSIVATEILYGGGHAGQQFAYHVVVPCSVWDAISGVCSYRRARQHWSETKEIITHTEIWALYKGRILTSRTQFCDRLAVWLKAAPWIVLGLPLAGNFCPLSLQSIFPQPRRVEIQIGRPRLSFSVAASYPWPVEHFPIIFRRVVS